MKIAFLVSSINSKSSGNGGHFFSLLETVKKVKRKHEVTIINIGDKKAKALSNCDEDIKISYLIFKRFSFFSIYRKLYNETKFHKFDIIHSFDSNAYLWGRVISWHLNLKSVLTKCGGINQIYYPYCSKFINYSKENQEYYSSKPKFKNSNMFLIPNRISEFDNDIERINSLNDHIKPHHRKSFKFIRVARIGSYYKKSIEQIVELIKYLNKKELKCILIIIGSVEDEAILKSLMSDNYSFIYFFTNIYYCKNAKELIDYSDAVMGTGRSFMEGAAKSKIMLSPLNKSRYPLLINIDNFDAAFSLNFSERVEWKEYNEIKNLDLIEKTIKDLDYRKQLTSYSKRMFDLNFSSKTILTNHEIVYNLKKRDNNLLFFDVILNYLYVLKVYYNG